MSRYSMIHMSCTYFTAYFHTGVRFRSDSSSTPESNGFITFVVELVGSSDSPVTIQVFSEETIPPQAQGMFVLLINNSKSFTFIYAIH